MGWDILSQCLSFQNKPQMYVKIYWSTDLSISNLLQLKKNTFNAKICE